MKIDQNEITIRDVCDAYVNNDEGGVNGYGGRLNIRPAYQREFVYKDQQRNAVIDTVRKGFPLNVMYWAKKSGTEHADGTKEADAFELLDGQQRTLSICEFVSNKFSILLPGDIVKYFHNMTEDERDQILNYKLIVYHCEGGDGEKLEWFKVINIAGERLYDQELRNAVYTGMWLTDAKKFFSKTAGPAYQIANKYMKGTAIRQDYLETALDWIREDNVTIEGYMAAHQNDDNAVELRNHFSNVITWTSALFGAHWRSEMKSVPWGKLYKDFHKQSFSAADLEKRVSALMAESDVTSKAGIYQYVFTGYERQLSIRGFDENQRRTAFERQSGVCPICIEKGAERTVYAIEEMQADHITPWSKGGKTTAENCKMLCARHNRDKSAI